MPSPSFGRSLFHTLSVVFPSFSGSFFAVKPSSLLLLSYYAAASVMPLYPPFFARLSRRHDISRNSNDVDYGGFFTSTTTTTPAVYVGTRHKYNYGSIFDKWFDLTEFDGREDFYEACQILHVDEWDAEFMLQDWEGILSHFVPESPINWDSIAAYRRAEEESREAAFIVRTEYTGECDYDAFDDAYCGEAEGEEDYVREMVEDNGLLNEVSESLRSYFDFEAWTRDLFSSGYVFHDGYIFSNRFMFGGETRRTGRKRMRLVPQSREILRQYRAPINARRRDAGQRELATAQVMDEVCYYMTYQRVVYIDGHFILQDDKGQQA